MSRRRRHPQPTMLFPTADEADACNHWCAGLHQVERAVAGQQFAEFFRIEDFMMMGMVRTPGQPDIYLHKHAFTRLYLNVDIAGHAFRYVASRFDLDDPASTCRTPTSWRPSTTSSCSRCRGWRAARSADRRWASTSTTTSATRRRSPGGAGGTSTAAHRSAAS